MLPKMMNCFRAEKAADGQLSARLAMCATGDLPPGDVVIRVRYSSLNYKDALASQGHPGVVRRFPHVPGIDAAGEVVESRSLRFKPGDPVLVTGFGLGSDCWGGYAEFICVPGEWPVPLPDGMTLRDTMIWGTAGFTAALCTQALLDRGARPERGEIIVTGASGGVGSLAVGILSRLGFTVAAVSGKPAARDLLTKLGAARVISREEAIDVSSRPLLNAAWAGAVDTVGGAMLGTIVRSMKYHGVATACGLVGGTDLPMNVYPFILRGVQLVGIDSGQQPAEIRPALWRKMAGDWKPVAFDDLASDISLDELPENIAAILRGEIMGRTIVAVG